MAKKSDKAAESEGAEGTATAPPGAAEFDALLASDESADAAGDWGDAGEAPEPAAAAPASAPSDSPAPAARAAQPEDDGEVAGDDSGPEAGSIESLNARAERLDRENAGLRREIFRRRERERVRREAEEQAAEAARVAQLEKSQREGLEFEQTPDGRLVLDPKSLQAHIDAAVAQRTAPQPATPAQRYQSMRTELLTEFDETTRPAVEAAAKKLEEAYAWLDAEVAKEFQETGLQPGQIGGMDGLLTFLDESGITEDFEARHPGIPIADLIVAPTNRRRAKRLVSGMIQTPGDEESEDAAPPAPRAPVRAGDRPPVPLGSRPRPPTMGSRGRARAPSAGATLVDIPADQLFEMTDEEFRQAERASSERMNRA